MRSISDLPSMQGTVPPYPNDDTLSKNGPGTFDTMSELGTFPPSWRRNITAVIEGIGDMSPMAREGRVRPLSGHRPNRNTAAQQAPAGPYGVLIIWVGDAAPHPFRKQFRSAPRTSRLCRGSLRCRTATFVGGLP